MSQKTRTQRLADIDNIKSLNVNDGQIDATELQTIARNEADSTQTITPVEAMAALDYDCSKTWRTKTLSSNSALTISNAKAGEFYVLLKTGAFTLTLPTGGNSFPTAGNVVPAGTYEITFGFDGTSYSFNYQQKTII